MTQTENGVITYRRLVAIVALAAMSAAGCSNASTNEQGASASAAPTDATAPPSDGAAVDPAPDPSTTPPDADRVPPESPLALDEWLSQPGERTTTELLGVVAAEIGPLDGVDPLYLTAGDGPQSLTGLVDELRTRGDDLSPAQQEAIVQLIAPPSEASLVSGPSMRGVGTVARQESSVQAMIRRAIAEISDRTGVSYRGEISAHFVDRDLVESDDTWAMAIASNDWIDPIDVSAFFGVFAETQGATSTARCHVFVGRLALASADEVGYEKVAHEVFHCFQYQAFNGSFQDFAATPGWIREGAPAWVGVELSGGAANSQLESWWRAYLKGNTAAAAYDLNFGTGYTAIGFYGFLRTRGIDPWPLVLPIINQSGPDAFETLTGNDEALLSEWASSTTQLGYTTAWSLSATGTTNHRREPLNIDLGPGRSVLREVPAMVNQVVNVTFGADVKYASIQLDGAGRMAWGGDDEQMLTRGAVLVCLAVECVCPDGSSPWGGQPYITRPQGDTATIGIGSFGDAASVLTAVPIRQEDACRVCIEGRWRQTEESVIRVLGRLVAGGIASDVSVRGSEIAKFGNGRLVVQFEPQTFIAVLGDPPGVIETTIAGEWSADYALNGDQLSIGQVDEQVTATQVVSIGGSSSGSQAIPFAPWATTTNTAIVDCQGDVMTIKIAAGIITDWVRLSE